MTADVVLVAAAALHAGFQLVVTALVYPALVDTRPTEWPVRHAAHTRRITPVVALVYGSVVAALVLVALDGLDPARGLVLAASVTAFSLTGLVAAPAHARLGHGWDERVVRRLVVADRLRLLLAVVAAVAAVVAAT